MAKRSQVSLRGESYAQVKAHCEKEGIPVTEFIDDLCTHFFGNGSAKSESSAGPLFTPENWDVRKVRF